MRNSEISLLLVLTISWNLAFWVMDVWHKSRSVTSFPHCLEHEGQNLFVWSKSSLPPALLPNFTPLLLSPSLSMARNTALHSLSQTCHVLSHPTAFAPAIPSARSTFSWVPFRSWILKFHLNDNNTRKKKKKISESQIVTKCCPTPQHYPFSRYWPPSPISLFPMGGKNPEGGHTLAESIARCSPCGECEWMSDHKINEVQAKQNKLWSWVLLKYWWSLLQEFQWTDEAARQFALVQRVYEWWNGEDR